MIQNPKQDHQVIGIVWQRERAVQIDFVDLDRRAERDPDLVDDPP